MQTRDEGWELLQVIRPDRTLARVPVIVCSGDLRFLRERAAHLRAKRCRSLAKPFAIAAMLRKIAAALGPVSARERSPRPRRLTRLLVCPVPPEHRRRVAGRPGHRGRG